MPVNGSTTFTANPQWCFSYYSSQCTGSSTSPQGTPEYSWSGGGGIFTIPTSCSGNQNCAPTGNTPGSTPLNLQAQELGCIYTPQAQVNVAPTITLSSPLWFFGTGVPTPSGFSLGSRNATLTASGAGNGTYVWTITNGSSKATFENSSSTITKTNVNTVGISSTSYSTQASDVTIQLQWTPSGGSQMTVNYSLSIDSPYKLASAGAVTSNGISTATCPNPQTGTAGYISYIPYDIISFFGVQITHIGVNETFGSRTDVYQGNNWPSPTAGGYTSADGSFADHACQTQPSGTPPSYPPGSPQSSLVFQMSQNWYVGSSTSGSGLIVQEDELEYYQTHGDHTGILSPVR